MSTIPPAEEIGDDLAVGSSAIGQGRVQATALQMAIVAATIGRRGRRPRPTLRLRRRARRPRRCARRAARTARTVERMMLAVVARRHRRRRRRSRASTVAGKTGHRRAQDDDALRARPGQPRRVPAAAARRPDRHRRVVLGLRPGGKARRASPSASCSWRAGAGGTTAAPARATSSRPASRRRHRRPEALDVEVDRRDLAGRGGRADLSSSGRFSRLRVGILNSSSAPWIDALPGGAVGLREDLGWARICTPPR